MYKTMQLIVTSIEVRKQMVEKRDLVKILKRITILSINYGKIIMTKCLLLRQPFNKTYVRPLHYRVERFDNNKLNISITEQNDCTMSEVRPIKRWNRCAIKNSALDTSLRLAPGVG